MGNNCSLTGSRRKERRGKIDVDVLEVEVDLRKVNVKVDEHERGQ